MLERLGLRPLWRELAIAYFEWALDSIDPLHDDVPFIVQRINELKAERLRTHTLGCKSKGLCNPVCRSPTSKSTSHANEPV